MGKVYDGIIGVAIGDALGVPVEFESRENIARNPVTAMRGNGTHHQPVGTWSDDTSLTLALLDSIVKNHGINYNDVMDKFSEWLLHGAYTATGEVFDVGNATSRAIMSYGRGCAPLMCGGISEYENGNGSLMRILPVAYDINMQPKLTINEQMHIVHNVSSLTHRHPISLIGCGMYVNIALQLLSAENPLETAIRKGLAEAFQYYTEQGWNEVSAYNRLKDLDCFAALPKESIKSSGYVVDTLEAALWCLLNTDSFETCVLKAVNLGSDTDTVGAVTVGLAGIYYGINNIPHEWLEAVSKREYIADLCAMLENQYYIDGD